MPSQLKVTSIERYHLCDDTDLNPNVIGCEVVVSGDVNLDIATAALRDAAQRHPMIYAQLSDQKNGKRKTWKLDPANLQQMVWQVVESDVESEQDATSAQPQEDLRLIDPAGTIASRFIVRRSGGLTRLSFRTHHATMDGLGGLQFVSDWVLAYHRISTGSSTPKSRKTNPEILHTRNHLRLLSRQFLGKLWVQPIAMFGAIKFLIRKVATPNQKKENQSTRTLPNDFLVLNASFSRDDLVALKAKAIEYKATVNELILRAVFLGIHEFRKRHNWHIKDEWLRLVIPMSIRDFADRRLPAANRATIVQLDRTDRDFRDPSGMMWGLNYELGNVKNWNLEKTFLLVIRCLSCIPGFIRRSAAKNVCRATSVVTNLGGPLERIKLERIDGKIRTGNLLIEDVGLIVPLRKQTPLGFAVLRYNGTQKFCMHFDPIQVDTKQAQEILDLVVENLRSEI